MLRATILMALLLGCGHVDYSKMPTAQQPRALLWGASNPECVAFCEVGVSVSQGERNGDGTQLKGGDISQQQSYVPTDNHSMSLGK
jgi:hypothetical protein